MTPAMAPSERPSNFSNLQAHDAQLVRLGMLAERYFAEDPNTCLLKLRQLTELLAQLLASKVGLYSAEEEKQVDLLRRLQVQGILPREVADPRPHSPFPETRARVPQRLAIVSRTDVTV